MIHIHKVMAAVPRPESSNMECVETVTKAEAASGEVEIKRIMCTVCCSEVVGAFSQSDLGGMAKI